LVRERRIAAKKKSQLSGRGTTWIYPSCRYVVPKSKMMCYGEAAASFHVRW
jgi:hypothetical protein